MFSPLYRPESLRHPLILAESGMFAAGCLERAGMGSAVSESEVGGLGANREQ